MVTKIQVIRIPICVSFPSQNAPYSWPLEPSFDLDLTYRTVASDTRVGNTERLL